jgi:hypothetical protein
MDIRPENENDKHEQMKGNVDVDVDMEIVKLSDRRSKLVSSSLSFSHIIIGIHIDRVIPPPLQSLGIENTGHTLLPFPSAKDDRRGLELRRRNGDGLG